MQWSDIQFHPPRATLRQFAWLWLVFFGALAIWQGIVRGNATGAVVFAVLALTVGPVGLARPEWLRPIYVGWMVVAFPIGWTISLLMLALLFYGLFTPLGLMLRLTGRDPLKRARHPEIETYWSPKAMPTSMRNYLRQF
jgi:hypothetical protein